MLDRLITLSRLLRHLLPTCSFFFLFLACFSNAFGFAVMVVLDFLKSLVLDAWEFGTPVVTDNVESFLMASTSSLH